MTLKATWKTLGEYMTAIESVADIECPNCKLPYLTEHGSNGIFYNNNGKWLHWCGGVWVECVVRSQ